jgi:hypothetical protein
MCNISNGKRFIVLPFVNRKAEDFAVRLKALVEENYTQVDFNVAFKAQYGAPNFLVLIYYS